jgi:topoisomerase-4 subunit A
VYHLIYRDGLSGNVYVKRFRINGVIRDKEYDLTRGIENSKVHYLSVNPNGEAEVVTVIHKEKKFLKKLEFDFNFGELDIKGRDSVGNILTKHPVKKVIQKSRGEATLSAIKIWFDDAVHRINTDEHGIYLGEFAGDDKILSITRSGHYKLNSFDLSTHFDEDIILIEKFEPQKPVSAIYYDGESKIWMVKRFIVEPTDKKVLFITENADSYLEFVSTDPNPEVEIIFAKSGGVQPRNKKVNLAQLIDIKGIKAKGNKLSDYRVKEVRECKAQNSKSQEPSPAHKPHQIKNQYSTEFTGETIHKITVNTGPTAQKPKVDSQVEFEIVPKQKEVVKEFVPKKKNKINRKLSKTKSPGKEKRQQMKLEL